MDVINAPELTLINPTTKIFSLTTDCPTKSLPKFNVWSNSLINSVVIHMVSSLFMHHSISRLVELEPTVESQLEIAEIDTMNEQSLQGDSGQIEQLQTIEGVQSHTEECNEENGNVTRSNDDVSLDVGKLNESDETVQYSGHLLRDQIRFGLRKHDGKQIAYNPRSTDTSHKNPANCRKRSKIHTCGECKKRFNGKGKLTIHLRVHSGEKPLKCKECSTAFSDPSSLKRHQRIHTGEKPFQCKECSAAFRQSDGLKIHQRKHSGEKPYQCKECSTAFSKSGSLRRHQRIHTGEKPFQCKECSAAFSQSGTLRRHQRIHYGEKSFMCDICKKSFRQKSKLLVHMDTHRGEKSFMCDICKKSFRQKSKLLVHMDTHRGKKSHKCNVCQKEFRSRYILRNHIKIHGKDDVTTLKKSFLFNTSNL